MAKFRLNLSELGFWICHSEFLTSTPSYNDEKFPKIVLPNSRHVSSIKQERVGIPTEALLMTEDGFYLKCQKAHITVYNLYSISTKKDPDTHLLNCLKQRSSAFWLEWLLRGTQTHQG